MSITPQDRIPLRRPSTQYSISFAFACTAIAFIGVALEEGPGISRTGAGSLFSQAGTIGLVVAFAVGFSVRLVFWARVGQETQALTRTVITAIFMLSIMVTIILSIICLRSLGTGLVPVGMVAFTVMSVLCQIATVIWLTRYRND